MAAPINPPMLTTTLFASTSTFAPSVRTRTLTTLERVTPPDPVVIGIAPTPTSPPAPPVSSPTMSDSSNISITPIPTDGASSSPKPVSDHSLPQWAVILTAIIVTITVMGILYLGCRCRRFRNRQRKEKTFWHELTDRDLEVGSIGDWIESQQLNVPHPAPQDSAVQDLPSPQPGTQFPQRTEVQDPSLQRSDSVISEKTLVAASRRSFRSKRNNHIGVAL